MGCTPSGTIRLVVVNQLPQQEQNAMLHLFSAREELVKYGAEHYRPQSSETTTFLHKLIERYRQEGVPMPFTLEEFNREYFAELLEKIPPEERAKLPAEVLQRGSPTDLLLYTVPKEQRSFTLKLLMRCMPTEEVLKGVPAEELLKGVPTEERLKGVPAEERLKGLSVNEQLAALSPEAIEALKKQLKANGSPPQP